MNSITIFDGQGNEVAYAFHVEHKQEIVLKGESTLVFKKFYPGGNNDDDRACELITLHADRNQLISNGVPSFRYKGKTYHIPSECYEVESYKEQTPVTWESVIDLLKRQLGENDNDQQPES